MSLYQKYRPQTLDQVKGNSDIILSLDNMLSNIKTCPHTFLLHGESGCGKTSIGRIIANRLGCVGTDFREINASDKNGVDDVRNIIQQSQFAPIEGETIVWLIDEVQRISGAAANSFLKILEDTPKHVFFILATTEPQKLLPTIRGRCQQFQVKPLTENQMFALLRKITKEEGETLEQEVFDQIIQDALGHPRNALQILEQVLSVPPDKRLEIAHQTATEQSQVIELCRALIKGEKWGAVSKILQGLKDQEPESIRRMVLGYMQSILLKEANERAAFIMECFWEVTYNHGFPMVVYNSFLATNK